MELISARGLCHVLPSAGKFVYREYKFIKYTMLDVPIRRLVLCAFIKQASRGVSHRAVSEETILLRVQETETRTKSASEGGSLRQRDGGLSSSEYVLNSPQSEFITSVIAYVFTVFKFHLCQSKGKNGNKVTS